MQGSYYFLDLDTNALIKCRRFMELLAPDSDITKIERWGQQDNPNGMLQFVDRNNDTYDWDDEHSPLVEDIAPKPEPATFPDIPAKIPGMILESNFPAVQTQPSPPEEQQMTAAVKNAGIDVKFEEFRFRGNSRGGEAHHPRDVVVTNNHFNIITAEHGEISPTDQTDEESVEDATSELTDRENASSDSDPDDKIYVDEELEILNLPMMN